MLRPPVDAVHPASVTALPSSMSGGILYQAKLDGYRLLAFIDADEVVLQARSHRIVTARFPEILPALATRPPGTVLDGEVVAWREGAFDFSALRSSPASRRNAGVAISYIAFDVLAEFDHDVRDLPLERRWARLLALLAGAPANLQPVMATRDRAEAESWMRLLAPAGVEGVVCKALDSPYRPLPGIWVKYRHGETIDAELVGTAGPEGVVHSARVRMPDGREITTLGLTTAQAKEVAAALAERPADAPPPVVEVRSSGVRHPHVRYVRARLDD